jgi:hypothetical protein
MRDQRKQDRLAGALSRTVESVKQESVQRLEGLFKQPGEPGYNATAEKPPEEWGPRTRTALLWATTTPEGRRALERVLQRWPSVHKMLPSARKRGGKVSKLHATTDSARAAKLS